MTFFVLGNGQFIRIETITTQEHIDKPIWQESKRTSHEFPFLIGNHNIRQMFQLLTQQLVETLRITSTMTIKKTILRFGTWILLQDIIHAGKRIEVIICKMIDNRFHSNVI